MIPAGSFWRKLLFLFRRERFNRELEEEMRFHLEMKARANREAGMDPDEARPTARRQFGNTTLLCETSREVWVWGWLERFAQDLRYALRVLRKSPGFTAVAVLSLALGIGANVAIFSLFNALMLRLLPVEHPEQLLSIYRTGGWGRGFASYPLYLALRERKDLFEGVLARSGVWKVRLGSNRAEFVSREFVSGDYFRVLGIRPALGRLFTDEDTGTQGANPFVVLSYDFWQVRLGGDASVLGRILHIDEQPLTVIGVAQPRFRGVVPERRADLWVPITMHRARIMDPHMHWVWLLARPKPDIEFRQLQTALDTFMQQHLAAEYGGRPDSAWRRAAMAQRLEIRPGGIGISLMREQFQKPLELLLALVALVLLIACANVAGLMLARGAARAREIALRFSLGASRLRVLHQLMTESLLIAGAGSLLGVAIAAWGTRYLLLFLPGAETLQLDVSADYTVLRFTLVAALVSVLVFGLLPAFRTTAVAPAPAIKGCPRASRGAPRLLLRKSFVVLQVALSVVVVMAAALFARSLASLRAVDPGFHSLNVLSFFIDFPRTYKDKDADSLRRRFLARVDSLPGVLSTSYGFPGPYQGGTWSTSFRIPGSEKTARSARDVEMQSAAPRYFETIGSPPLFGREFDSGDSAGAAKVAVVNESFAREYFSGANPVGRTLSFDDSKPEGGEPTIIVGLVRDMLHSGMRQRAVPTVYVPPAQVENPSAPLLLLRAAVPSESLIPALRRELTALDPSLAMVGVRSMRQRIDDSLFLDRLLAVVSGFFGILSLLLAGIGVYGVVAYTVKQRTSEIGIRMALGADRISVFWLVLRQGLALIAVGILLGVPLSFAPARIAAGLLFGIKARDPITMGATAAVLLMAGVLAVVLPARRAMHIDPMEALRYE